MSSRIIVEDNLYKLKGVLGILETMAASDDGCVVIELPYSYDLLAKIIREICAELQMVVDGVIE